MFDRSERLTQLRLGRSAEHTHRRPSMQIGPPAKRQRLRRLERNQRIDGTIGAIPASSAAAVDVIRIAAA